MLENSLDYLAYFGKLKCMTKIEEITNKTEEYNNLWLHKF
jgi:hypothetical protein